MNLSKPRDGSIDDPLDLRPLSSDKLTLWYLAWDAEDGWWATKAGGPEVIRSYPKDRYQRVVEAAALAARNFPATGLSQEEKGLMQALLLAGVDFMDARLRKPQETP